MGLASHPEMCWAFQAGGHQQAELGHFCLQWRWWWGLMLTVTRVGLGPFWALKILPCSISSFLAWSCRGPGEGKIVSMTSCSAGEKWSVTSPGNAQHNLSLLALCKLAVNNISSVSLQTSKIIPAVGGSLVRGGSCKFNCSFRTWAKSESKQSDKNYSHLNIVKG